MESIDERSMYIYIRVQQPERKRNHLVVVLL